MSRAEELWERLVRAALRKERSGIDAFRRRMSGIAGNVPSSLANNGYIDEILRVADEIQDEDPNVSRILCGHAYSLAQNLDPNSEGRGVLQFKTGLMFVIKKKLAKEEGVKIDKSQDIAKLREFYKLYRDKNKVDKLREDEMKLRESGAFSGNIIELERKTVERKRLFATLKVLGTVLEQLTKEVSPEDAESLIPEERMTSQGSVVSANLWPTRVCDCRFKRPCQIRTSRCHNNPGRLYFASTCSSGQCNGLVEWVDKFVERMQHSESPRYQVDGPRGHEASLEFFHDPRWVQMHEEQRLMKQTQRWQSLIIFFLVVVVLGLLFRK